jgi:hypothetical protein
MLSAAAVEPQALGKGRSDQVMNLEAGARTSPLASSFGSGGFVPPSTPQPMQLSSAVMVYQSEKLRDQSESLFWKTSDLLNQTRDLAKKVEDLEASSRENAIRSEQSAGLSQSKLEETKSIYNETRTSARKIEAWERWLAYASILKGPQPGFVKENYPGELEALRGQVKTLTDLIRHMDMKIEELENNTLAR